MQSEPGWDMAGAAGEGAIAAFANSPCEVERRPGGQLVLRSSLPQAPYPDSVIAVLKARAELAGDEVLFREAGADGITGELNCRDAYFLACKIGRIYLELGASPERPVALIADNSIQTAIAVLG